MTETRGSRSGDNVIPFPHRGIPGPSETPRGTPWLPGAEAATDWGGHEPSLSSLPPRRSRVPELLGGVRLVADGAERPEPHERPGRPDLRRVRDGSVMLRLHVDLEHSFPPVWRRIEVSADLRLDQLHDVVSQAMGWDDVHLHGFRSAFRGEAGVVMPTLLTDAELDDAHDTDDDRAGHDCDADGVDDVGDVGDAGGVHLLGGVRDLHSTTGVRAGEVHESQVSVGEVLAEVGDVLHYDYDMACGWRHVISVEGVRARAEGEPRAALLAEADGVGAKPAD